MVVANQRYRSERTVSETLFFGLRLWAVFHLLAVGASGAR